MTGFLILKTIHVLAAITAVGANATYGAWSARGARDEAHLGFALRGVKFIDDRIANPAYGVLLITGVIMAVTQYTLRLTWIITGIAIFVVVAALATGIYTPALRRQIELLDTEGIASPAYKKVSATAAGVGLFMAVLLIVVVVDMVFKPQL
jgi:hypothetical protein